MHIAEYKLQMGATDECKTLVEEGKETLDTMENVSTAATEMSKLNLQSLLLTVCLLYITCCR